jgi:F-type H+-transporting ATPase subunit c
MQIQKLSRINCNRAGLGIGKIGGSAMDAIARQPEARGNPNSYAYAAALIEGIGSGGLFYEKILKTKLQRLVVTIGFFKTSKFAFKDLKIHNLKKFIIDIMDKLIMIFRLVYLFGR